MARRLRTLRHPSSSQLRWLSLRGSRPNCPRPSCRGLSRPLCRSVRLRFRLRCRSQHLWSSLRRRLVRCSRTKRVCHQSPRLVMPTRADMPPRAEAPEPVVEPVPRAIVKVEQPNQAPVFRSRRSSWRSLVRAGCRADGYSCRSPSRSRPRVAPALSKQLR
ncbi:MAG: hypothetical protein ACJAXA_002563 [Candidatus Aldehydirespiratoraceae bacterium]|jgi:hypothetical protein